MQFGCMIYKIIFKKLQVVTVTLIQARANVSRHLCSAQQKHLVLHVTAKFLIHPRIQQVSEFRGDIPQTETGRKVHS